MKAVLLPLLAAVALVVSPAVAMAGGGTKGAGTVRIRNNSGDTIIAIVARSNNPLTNLSNLLNSPGTVTEANVRVAAARDGARVVVVNDGNTGTVAGLQQGANTVTVADITAGNVGGGFVETSGNINVNRGQTVTATVGPGGVF